MDLEYRSELPSVLLDALERLLFFNPNQNGVQSAIVEALNLYGSPEIVSRRSGISVALTAAPDAQCLFALARGNGSVDLAGVLVYLRRGNQLVIVHIAVATATSGSASSRGIARSMIRTLRRVAQRLRGVESLVLFYGRGRFLTLRRREPSPSLQTIG